MEKSAPSSKTKGQRLFQRVKKIYGRKTPWFQIYVSVRRHLDDIKKYVPEFVPEFIPEFVAEFDLNTDFYSGTNSGINSGTNFFYIV